jgi:hypothetical protein
LQAEAARALQEAEAETAAPAEGDSEG